MNGLLTFWQEGGWPMYPVLLCGFAAVGLGLLAALVKQRVLVGLSVAALVLCGLFGVGGTLNGRRNVRAAVALADPASRTLILEQGDAESLRPTQLAAGLAVLAFPLLVVGFMRSQHRA